MATKTIITYAKNGDLEKVKEELQNGADVNLGEGKATALSFTATFGYFDMAKLLTSHGANVNVLDSDNCTAISWAGNMGHMDIVKLLLENGAELNVAGKHGVTPLLHAVMGGHREIVELYLKNGADTKMTLKVGTTPLMIACKFGFLDIAKLLLPYSDIDHQNKDGLTALMLSSENNHIEVVDFLLQSGANPNLSDKAFSATALMKAAQNGHLEVVKLLATHGADIMAQDKNGRTALDVCKKHQKLHRYLIEQLEVSNHDKVGGK